MDEGCVYYVPPIRKFEDTGFVTHGFQDGSLISARVVKSNDSGGFAIELLTKVGKEKEAVITLDRFAALCLCDCIIKNLLNQEELIDNEYRKQFNIRRGTGPKGDGMGGGKGAE